MLNEPSMGTSSVNDGRPSGEDISPRNNEIGGANISESNKNDDPSI